MNAYIYDDLGRLIEEISQSSDSLLQYDTKYTLDLVGNRLEKETIQGGDTNVINSTYNARDELRTESPTHNGTTGAVTNYDYDLNGSRIEKTTVGGDSATYTFDLRNRLSAATIDRTEDGHDVHAETAYEYNDSGIRVTSQETITIDAGDPTTATKVFLTDPNNPTGFSQVLEVRSSSTASPNMTYIIGLDVISQTNASNTYNLISDGLGSTRQVVTPATSVIASYFYDAYGIQITNPSTTLEAGYSALRYTGEQFDAVLHETYLRARFMESKSGLFTSRDWVLGSSNSPLSLHQRLYAQLDPVNLTDPSGNIAAALIFAGIGGAAVGSSVFALSGGSAWEGAKEGLLLGLSFSVGFTLGPTEFSRIAVSGITQSAAAMLADVIGQYLEYHLRYQTYGGRFPVDADSIIRAGFRGLSSGASQAIVSMFYEDHPWEEFVYRNLYVVVSRYANHAITTGEFLPDRMFWNDLINALLISNSLTYILKAARLSDHGRPEVFSHLSEPYLKEILTDLRTHYAWLLLGVINSGLSGEVFKQLLRLRP